MQVLPLQTANGANPAAAGKSPQGGKASGAAALLGVGAAGGTVGAPANPTAATAATAATTPATPSAVAIPALFGGAPGQLVATAAGQIAGKTGEITAEGGVAGQTPASQILEILHGAPPVNPNAAVQPVPAVDPVPVANPATTGQTPTAADDGAPTLPGAPVTVTPDAAKVADAATGAQQPKPGAGQPVAADHGATPATGSTPPVQAQAPAADAPESPESAEQHAAKNGAVVSENAKARSAVAASAQAAQDATQNSALPAAVRPVTTPTGSGDAPGARERRTAALRSGPPQPGGQGSANPARNGIPANSSAQQAPGLAIANQAVTGNTPAQTGAGQPFETLVTTPNANPDTAPAPTVQTPSTPASAAAAGNEIRAAVETSPQTAAYQSAKNLAPQAPAEQMAVQISRAVAEGSDRITMELQPAKLGRVTVELEFGANNRLIAVIAAERQDTLDLLKQDSRALERALNDSGLKTDSGSLSFNLRGDGNPHAKGDDSGQASGPTIHLPVGEDIAEQAMQYDRTRAIGLNSGIDIRV